MEGYYDYLFLLQPSDAVKEQIKHCKLKACEYIGHYQGMKATAHLSICEITRQKPHVIDSYLQTVKNKVNSIPPVNLEINGFDFFMHSNEHMTIYAAIKPTYKTDNWFALLKKLLNSKRPLTPHITVTRYIPVNDFYKLWPELRQVRYQDSFVANRLTILEKETFKPNAKYNIREEIYFKNELKAQY
ncbi:2'-5' RNA ligase family protein [Mucilaginibacter sp. PAMB04168]|uniref:2'-5' RNA ligase family protein n=1 Tax=Mucilaginibacter sp. PAMB04168 TaxID=3138567 RepID=UPI0031F5F3B7